MHPKVITWFKVYATVLCFMYLLVTAVGVLFMIIPHETLDMDRLEALLVGGLCLGFGIVFFAASVLPLLLRPRPWLWTYNLVLICLGLTSILTLPACVPLLIYWMKPEAKQFYGAQ